MQYCNLKIFMANVERFFDFKCSKCVGEKGAYRRLANVESLAAECPLCGTVNKAVVEKRDNRHEILNHYGDGPRYMDKDGNAIKDKAGNVLGGFSKDI